MTTQLPEPGSLNIDHVAHFVPDSDAASAALEHLGFTLTPFSPQSHRLQPGGPLVPAGTGNRCVMLESGYLEFLTPTAVTPIADQLRTAIQRYIGVHLIAFGTSAPEADYARLADGGFQPLSPVALQRPIGTESGEDTARFTVVRVPPGTMPEGRIQFCQHHTPHLVWQPRWLEHANRATALSAVLLCVQDPQEAAERYGRYTGLPFAREGDVRHIHTARGTLSFIEAGMFTRTLGVDVPTLPWIAGYALASSDLAATRDFLGGRVANTLDLPGGACAVVLPEALGGVAVFHKPRTTPLHFD